MSDIAVLKFGLILMFVKKYRVVSPIWARHPDILKIDNL